MDENIKYKALLRKLQGIDSDMGIYPSAIKGYNDERDYEQRDGYKNGWNAAIMQYGMEICKAIEEADKDAINEDLALLLIPEIIEKREDGKFIISFNDVWSWATSDCEIVEESEIPQIARLYRRYGWCGILYWATTRNPGLRSEFKDNNRFIDFVDREEALIKIEPDSNKRAYIDL